MQRFKAGQFVDYNGKKFEISAAYGDGDLKLIGVQGFVHKRNVKLWVTRGKKKMAKAHPMNAIGNTLSTALTKSVLTIKLRVPKGMKLNDKEAQYVIDGWEDQKTIVRTKQVDLEKVSLKIEKQIAQSGIDTLESLKQLKEAKRYFEQSKDPLARRKWARKVVIRDSFYKQSRGSNLALTSTIERIKDAVDDAQYVYKTLESRIAEARIYRELNSGLHLVGKSLIEARTKHMLPEIEYQNLETTMESIEREVSQKDDDKLLVEAELIVNDATRWTEDDRKTKTHTPKATKGK